MGSGKSLSPSVPRNNQIGPNTMGSGGFTSTTSNSSVSGAGIGMSDSVTARGGNFFGSGN